jgi:UDP-N-acetyl-D-glucosamine dehydrogenase
MSKINVLMGRIDRRDYQISVIGLGYVGLPLALAFSKRGFPVLGIDVDRHKVDKVNRRISYLSHVPSSRFDECTAPFKATTDFEELRFADAILICVPTPLDHHQQPDMQYVEATVDEVKRWLRSDQLIVLESTTYPGTTDEFIQPFLRNQDIRLGRPTSFYLAYSPEREDPGNTQFSTTTTPKLVGGVDPDSTELAAHLYGTIAPVVRVANSRVAEAAKLTENIFRAVNIALVNELKIVFDKMGIDVWQVLDAAATKPFGFMRFNPGPGWGGHCIPVDPFYLSWKARAYGVTPKFIELAGEINIRMHEYVVGKLVEGLNAQGKALRDAKVLILGVAYKANVDDCRESPAFPIMAMIVKLGGSVRYHDPLVSRIPHLRDWPAFVGAESDPLDEAVLRGSDAVLVVTAHSAVDYEMVGKYASLIVDSRGVFKPEQTSQLVRA